MSTLFSVDIIRPSQSHFVLQLNSIPQKKNSIDGSGARGQFHQHAYMQLLCMQILKAQKDSQVISRKKNWPTYCPAVLQQICGLRYLLMFDKIDPRSLLLLQSLILLWSLSLSRNYAILPILPFAREFIDKENPSQSSFSWM